MKGQYVDESLVGYERELAADFVIGLKGNWRTLGRVIEDLRSGENEYLFGNPGEGKAATLAFFDGSGAPSPRARRDNYSLELTARKRLSHGWQLLASYVWTRLRGNYDGVFQRAGGNTFVFANYNSSFDHADFMVNADGPSPQRVSTADAGHSRSNRRASTALLLTATHVKRSCRSRFSAKAGSRAKTRAAPSARRPRLEPEAPTWPGPPPSRTYGSGHR